MIGTFFFLVFHSWKNRLLMRVRRLKQPKYLVGGIFGGLYFCWVYGVQFFSGTRHFRGSGIPGISSPEMAAWVETIGAAVLALMALTTWIFGNDRAALVFSEAEVAFLFPAPVSRRNLIHFKLLKAQLAILLMIFFLTIFFGRIQGGASAWARALGWWVVLCALTLHGLGASFARSALLDRGFSSWKRRLLILFLLVAVVGSTAWWEMQSLPPIKAGSLSLEDVKLYTGRILDSGPLPYLLFPFRLLVRPRLAPDIPGFLLALGPALGILFLLYLWVIKSNVAFEEASVDASRQMADRVAAFRANRGRMPSGPAKKKRAPFELRPVGFPLVGVFWKNLIGAGQIFTLRFWVIIAAMTIPAGIAMTATVKTAGVAALLQPFVLMLVGLSFVVGPQLVRQDFRRDLPMADVLKTYPLRGWQVALGELLAPVVILTGVQWLGLILCACLPAPFGEHGISFLTRCAFALGLAVIAPGLNFVTLMIPNAAVLLFPGWFQTGKDATQGIEATGQRIIFSIGQMLALAIALVPAVAVFAAAYFLLRLVLGPILPVPIAAALVAVVLGVEAWFGLQWLGRVFERLDLSLESGA